MQRIFFVFLLLFASVVYGATEKFTFEKGWNLAGSFLSFPLDELSNVTDIKTVWLWNGSGWKVWSPDEKILSFINSYGLPVADAVGQGEGFWVNANKNVEVSVYGTNSSDFDFNLSDKGWYLLSPPVERELEVKNVFFSDSVVSLWKWEDGKWRVWSPSEKIMELVESYGLDSFDSVKPGEGFWINLKKDLKLKFGSEDNKDNYLNFLILEDETLSPVNSTIVETPDGEKLLISGWSLKLPFKSGTYTFYRDGFENCTVHYTKTDKSANCFVVKDKTVVVFLKRDEKEPPFPLPYLDDEKLLWSWQSLVSAEAVAPKPITASSAFTEEEGFLVIKNMNPEEDYTVSVLLMPESEVEWNGKGKPLYYFVVYVENSYGDPLNEAKGEFEAKPVVNLNGVKLNFDYFYLYEKTQNGWEPVCKVDLVNDSLKPSCFASKLSDFLIVGYTKEDMVKFSGKIIDEDGNPVKDAVVISDSKAIFSANETGEISAVFPPETSKLLIFAPNYQPIELKPPYPEVIKLKKFEKILFPYEELSFYYQFPSPVYADIIEKGNELYFFTSYGAIYSLKNGNKVKEEFQFSDGYIYRSVTSFKDGFVGTLLNFDGTIFYYDLNGKKLYTTNVSDVLFDSYYSYYSPVVCGDVVYFIFTKELGIGYVLPAKFSNGDFFFSVPLQLEEGEMVDNGACLGENLIAGTFNLKTGGGRILEIEPSGKLLLSKNTEGIKAEPLLLSDGSLIFGSCNGTVYKVKDEQVLIQKSLWDFCIYRLSLLEDDSIALSTDKGVIIIDNTLDEVESISTDFPVIGKVFNYGDTFVFSTVDGVVYAGSKPVIHFERDVVNYNLINDSLFIQTVGGEVLSFKLPEEEE